MLKELLQRYPALSVIENELQTAVDMMYACYTAGGKILLCGNGGSCADCDHIVGELMKGFLSLRPLGEEQVKLFEGLCEDPAGFARKLQGGIPAISLPAQGAVLTAFCNDVDPAMMYAQLTYAYGRPQDLLIGLSTSGNAANVSNAVIAAKALGMHTVGLTGARESRLSRLCDLTLKAPETETFKIQELHLPIYHYLCAALEARIFG